MTEAAVAFHAADAALTRGTYGRYRDDIVTARASVRADHGGAARGRLVHRIDRVCTVWRVGTTPRLAARFACGNRTQYAVVGDAVEDRALCPRCDFDGVQAAGLVVYFAERNGVVKIGCSTNVMQRVGGLRAKLLAVESGGFARERELHELFTADRSHGEWFRPSDALRSYIADLQAAA